MHRVLPEAWRPPTDTCGIVTVTPSRAREGSLDHPFKRGQYDSVHFIEVKLAAISEALTIAIEHHQGGRLQAAEQIYRQILQVEPNHPDALHLLGVIAFTVGKPEIAIEHIGRALQLKPDFAEAHYNLANALKDQGKRDEAVACYRRALALKPDFAEAHNNLGLALSDQGKLDEAVDCYRRALALKPDYAKAR